MNWDRTDTCILSLLQRKTEAAEIERISRETLPLLEEIRDNVSDQAKVNRLIARIDQLRREINAFGRTYDLATQLTQSTELQRFKADRKINAAKLTGEELQQRQVGRDIDNVQGVADAAKEFQKLMDEVIAGLTADAARHAKAGAMK